jgi:N,N'-diacetyllegionaminate synthase
MIAAKPIFDIPKTFIIAEAGVNHNGSIDLAKQLIDAASKAGASAVKFQLFNPEQLTSKVAPLAEYQAQGSGEAENQLDMLNALALLPEDFRVLQAYAKQKNILFLCSPFDDESARYLHEELKLPCIKLGSGELTNIPLLQKIAAWKTPIILSTGMANLKETQEAVACIQKSSPLGEQHPLAILHCTSSYPAPFESLNLKACQTLAQHFPHCVVGYSDHSEGIHASIAAVALGVRIIEKHFTLDKNLPGPDHKASISVEELSALVQQIRDIEIALGSGVKEPHPIEQDCTQVARKSLVAARHLPAGHCLTSNDILVKRPGIGIPPAKFDQLIGLTLAQAIQEDALFPDELLMQTLVKI